jgi:hypothetical protein
MAAKSCYTAVPMDDALRAQFQEVADEVDGLMDEVEQAFDEHATFAFGLATRVKVEEATKKYREMLAALAEEKDRSDVERRIGRRVMDLLRMAGKLPAPPQGKPAQVKITNEFFETREGKSSRKPVTPGLAAGQVSQRKQEKPKYSVSGDIDSWCGPCADIKTHTIIAMVGDEPAQVVCQVCGSRHKFRSESSRRKAGENGTPAATTGGKSAAGPVPGDRKMEERNAFITELRNAPNVKTFSPKDRYKVGEIIEHPELGRGKIENTLPRSLLVRFPSGLRPVKLT